MLWIVLGVALAWCVAAWFFFRVVANAADDMVAMQWTGYGGGFSVPETDPDVYRTLAQQMNAALYGDNSYHEQSLAARELAHAKAINLLKDWLNPVQLVEFECHKHFHVKGSHTGQCYRIRFADAFFNVDELDANGAVSQRLCFIPANSAQAPGDIMLAQKIMLERDEPEALRVTNISPAYVPGMYASLQVDLARVTREAYGHSTASITA